MRLTALTGKLPDELTDGLGEDEAQCWLLINSKMRECSKKTLHEAWGKIPPNADPSAYGFVVAVGMGELIGGPI